MSKSIGELRERGAVVEQYRVYRRGIITLPYLERDLAKDLQKFDEYIESHSDSVLQPGFIEIAIMDIETTKEAIDSTLQALEGLMDYVANSGRVMDAETHAQYVSENSRDEEAESLILNTLRIHGGISALLQTSHDLLAQKQSAYAQALKTAKLRTPDSWNQALKILKDHYDGELETLEDYWRRRLKEEKETAGGKPYFSQVTYDLCTRYPELAKQLGVECPKEMIWPIILIAVACAILCEGG